MFRRLIGMALLALCVIQLGCGRPETADRADSKAPSPASTPPAVAAAPAGPQTAERVVSSEPDLAATNAFETALQEVLALEQAGEYSRALQLGRKMQELFASHPSAETLLPVIPRLTDGRRDAVELGVAIDNLATRTSIAEEALREGGPVGVILLRKAVRERDGGVLLGAARLLIERSDPLTPDLLVGRLRTMKDPAVAADLLTELVRCKEQIALARLSDLLPFFGTLPGGVPTPLPQQQAETILQELARRPEVASNLVQVVQSCRAGESFTNRQAVAFLGMIRQSQFGGDAAALNSAAGDPKLNEALVAYLTPLAESKDPNDLAFAARCLDYFPELGVGMVPGLVLWLRSDLPMSLTITNGVVAEWRDQSGRGYHARQTTATQSPVLRPAEKGVAGKPVIQFDGVDDHLQLGNLAPATSNAATLFVVADVQSPNYDIFSTHVSGSMDPWWRHAPNGKAYPAVFRSVRIDTYTDMPEKGTHIFMVASSTNAWEMAIDGVSRGVVPPAYSPGLNCSLAAGHFLGGGIAEVILFGRPLAPAERAAIDRYLSTRWGVPLPKPTP